MGAIENSSSASIFRTRAWVQSWLDIWGKDPRIQLIDLGGRADPLEMMYVIRHKLKGFLPVKTLVIAGYGYAEFDPPRAEYSNLQSFVKLAGGLMPLANELKSIKWNQWALPDLQFKALTEQEMGDFSDQFGWRTITSRVDVSYRVTPTSFAEYLNQLGDSSRQKYFKRRQKLKKYGSLELIDSVSEVEFFNQLNQFHLTRWGRPCYSRDSMEFFSLFLKRIKDEGGVPIMQYMKVANEIVAVLFDVIWNGVRYNLQSGYIERRFPQIALGAIHLGLAIEKSINDNLVYDLLAGHGKHTNYKEKISTQIIPMNSYCLTRGWLKDIYRLYGK